MRMLAIGLRALDVSDERIHFEFFGPAEALYA
jgi:ferredoxin-NADP reductase